MGETSPVFELRVAITVGDYEAALRFWRDALGLPLSREFGEGADRGAILAAGQATVEIVTRDAAAGIDRIEAGAVVGAPLRLALEVADSPAVGDRLAAAGGAPRGTPVETPWGHRNVRLRSPEGIEITLFTVVKPPQP